MKKNLIIAIVFVLIFTHIIPPYNISFANDEVNECEMMNFTIQTIKENDKKIIGTAEESDNLEIEFKTKNKTDVINLDSNRNFELTVEEEFLELNNEVVISNEYFKIETNVVSEEAAVSAVESIQYVECPVVEKVEELNGETENADTAEDSEEVIEEVIEEAEVIPGKLNEDISEEREITTEENSEEIVNNEEERKTEVTTKEDVIDMQENKAYENSEKIKEKIIDTDEPPRYEDGYVRNFNSKTNIEKITDTRTLGNVEILTNYNMSGTGQPVVSDESGNYNVDIAVQANGVADVELVGDERFIIIHSPELNGKFIDNGSTGIVTVDLTAVTLENLGLQTGLNEVTSKLTGLVGQLLGPLGGLLEALGLVGGINEVSDALAAVNDLGTTLQGITSYEGAVDYYIGNNGELIIEYPVGIGNHFTPLVRDTVLDTLNRLADAIGALEVPLLNFLVGPVVQSLKGVLQTTLNPLIANITSGTIDLANVLADAQLLGLTSLDINVDIKNPAQAPNNEAELYVAGTQSSVIDLNLLAQKSANATLQFDEPIDIQAPILDTATINGNSTKGYIVTGTGEEAGDKILLSKRGGTQLDDTTFTKDGTYSFDIAPGTVEPLDVLVIQAVDEAGNESNIVQVIVPDDIVKIESVPSIEFNTTMISSGEKTIFRKEKNEDIKITDTRLEGAWYLSASASTLETKKGDILPNALIYIKDDGEEVMIENKETRVASSSDENVSSEGIIDTINWNRDKGILLKLNPLTAAADEPYTSTINWTLTHGPNAN